MSVKFLKNESEEGLLQMIKTGDYSAFEELYARHFQTVYTTMGREVHSVYKLADHALDLWKFKEFKGIKGIRPDFVDFNTRTIYELKPYNPNGFKRAMNS